MSFILNALKKAEQERSPFAKDIKNEAISDANWSLGEPQIEGRRDYSFFIVVVLLATVCLGGFYILFSNSKTIDPAQAEVQILESDVDSPLELRGVFTDDAGDADTLAATRPFIEQKKIFESVRTNEHSENPVLEPGIGNHSHPTIEGHLFFPSESGLNRIFVEGNSYRVGETIRINSNENYANTCHYRVLEINENWVELECTSQTIRLRVVN